MERRFDLIVFDLDGTLVDSLPDITSALNAALVEAGRSALSEAVVRTLVGEGVERLAERALAAQPGHGAGGAPAGREVTAASLAGRVRAIYRQQPCRETRIYDGMVETLTALRRASGRRLAVLTNKPGEVARPLLEALALADAFDAVLGDGDGYPRKPDPGGARALLARFGVAPDRCLMVGDGLPDLALASAVPCPVAAALWGYTPADQLRARRPDFVLASPRDLTAVAGG